MKKNIILLGAVLISGIAFSQVGVNTDAPKATLDVVGKATDTSSLDGIIAPRLTGVQLRAKTYTTEQTGTLVYVTTADTAPAGQTVNVNSIGYFYFDGAVWQKVGNGATAPVNIYNANGTLTSGRTLTQNGFSLAFLGTNQSTSFFPNNGISQTGIAGGKRASITLTSNDNNSDGVSSNMQLFQDPEQLSQIIVGSDSRGLSIGTSFTTQPAPITFITNTGNTNGTERARITPTGNFGVNTQGFASEKLDVNGISRIRTLPLNGATNAINTTSGGTASASQDQTFTATRTVVADANGVLGSVDWVASPPIVIAGADGADAVATTQMVRVRNSAGSVSTTALATKTFTLTKKSLVTVSYMLTVGNVLAYDGSSLVDGVNKKLGTYVTVNGTVNMASAVPFSNHATPYASGNFPLGSTRSFVLNAGTHTVSLFGEVFAAATDSIGVQATFGLFTEELDIIAVPIP